MSEAAVYAPTRRSAAQRTMLTLAALPAGGIVAFALGLALGVRGADLGVLSLAIVTLFIMLVPVILDQARPHLQRHLLLTLLMLVHIVYFVLPVFTQYFFEDLKPTRGYASVVHRTPEAVIRGQLAVILGIFSIFVGYSLVPSRPLRQLLPEPAREWSHTATLSVACVMTALAWIVFLAAHLGFIPATAGTGIWNPLMSFTFYGIALLTLAYLRYRSRIAVLLMLVLIPITMGFNLFTGSRGKFLAPLIMVALAYVMVERRIRRSWALAGFLTVVFFFPLSGFIRDVVLDELTLGIFDVIGNPLAVLRGASNFVAGYSLSQWFFDGLSATATRFDGLGVLSLIMQDTPSRVPFQGGWTIGYIFLSWIPRFLWPDKPPIAIGRWVYTTYTEGTTETSMGPSWMGEFYLNFGWIGILVGMILFGITFRVAHEILYRKPTVLLMLAAVIFTNVGIRPLGSGTLLLPISETIFTIILPLSALHLVVSGLGGTRPYAPWSTVNSAGGHTRSAARGGPEPPLTSPGRPGSVQ